MIYALYSYKVVTHNKPEGLRKEAIKGIVNTCFLLNFAVH